MERILQDPIIFPLEEQFEDLHGNFGTCSPTPQKSTLLSGGSGASFNYEDKSVYFMTLSAHDGGLGRLTPLSWAGGVSVAFESSWIRLQCLGAHKYRVAIAHAEV